MALAVGTLLALAVGAFATILGLDRERGFYPTVMIVIASLYSLFAVLGGSTQVLMLELLAGAVFVAAAALGFRRSLWIVVLALAGHGLFDLLHGHVITNPGVPAWYAHFCSAYDFVAAAYFAWRLLRMESQGGRTRLMA